MKNEVFPYGNDGHTRSKTFQRALKQLVVPINEAKSYS